MKNGIWFTSHWDVCHVSSVNISDVCVCCSVPVRRRLRDLGIGEHVSFSGDGYGDDRSDRFLLKACKLRGSV